MLFSYVNLNGNLHRIISYLQYYLKSNKHSYNPISSAMSHNNFKKGILKMFKNEPDLLTRKQCQELLHISKSKMLELIHGNYIPARIIAGS